LPQPLAEQLDVEEALAEPSLRRCALTRERRPKADLIRFVLSPAGEIVPDLKGTLPGRGVWLLADHDTVAEAVRRNVFAKALKGKVKVPANLPETVEQLLTEAAKGAFALANKTGEVVFGNAKVEQAIAKGKVLALVHALEAAPDGCRKLDSKLRAADPVARPPVRGLTTDELGLASGRSNVIHAALIQGGAARKFLATASRLERYCKGTAVIF
jgi:predicted RNA-binding protein YlxR (DUF448 family)